MDRGRPRSRPGRRGALAERIRQARTARSLNQDRAAEAIGVSRVTLARWETGSHRPRGPALRFVELWVAAALGEEMSLGN
jgi:DNA-binding transcriptional regulator YiaG